MIRDREIFSGGQENVPVRSRSVLEVWDRWDPSRYSDAWKTPMLFTHGETWSTECQLLKYSPHFKPVPSEEACPGFWFPRTRDMQLGSLRTWRSGMRKWWNGH
jgi:hypothetical protein